ncbi:YraN family protein [Ectothiorhodospira mobilis]|uniref:YraN family protein n=1 Tax=Ectothiorhodospira mobilis TaxID=195064 RepID=UPI0019031D64|nr:YraN family protein [Ectothiorhodospira mobilis]MBK1692705.1 YraN family protein [Ectothiorhodospira mobilis]
MNRRAQGDRAEARARAHLESRGLRLLTAQYRCKAGEIDLVMEDQGTLVFVEVRQRRSARFGGALASIDTRKQRRILAAAAHYLQAHGQGRSARLDVVVIEADDRIQWIPNAFEAHS